MMQIMVSDVYSAHLGLHVPTATFAADQTRQKGRFDTEFRSGEADRSSAPTGQPRTLFSSAAAVLRCNGYRHDFLSVSIPSTPSLGC